MKVAGREVECCQCGKRYVCTPAQDYFFYADMPDELKSTWTGYCWRCFVGTDQPEPAPGDDLGIFRSWP